MELSPDNQQVIARLGLVANNGVFVVSVETIQRLMSVARQEGAAAVSVSEETFRAGFQAGWGMAKAESIYPAEQEENDAWADFKPRSPSEDPASLTDSGLCYSIRGSETEEQAFKRAAFAEITRLRQQVARIVKDTGYTGS